MIYVPDISKACYVVYNDGILRAYDEVPSYNSDVTYTDYYVNMDYYPRYGTQSFGSYSSLPTCINSNLLTNSVAYRLDFYKILIVFFILIFIFYFIVKKIVRALFFGGRYA